MGWDVEKRRGKSWSVLGDAGEPWAWVREASVLYTHIQFEIQDINPTQLISDTLRPKATSIASICFRSLVPSPKKKKTKRLNNYNNFLLFQLIHPGASPNPLLTWISIQKLITNGMPQCLIPRVVDWLAGVSGLQVQLLYYMYMYASERLSFHFLFDVMIHTSKKVLPLSYTYTY